MAVKYTKPRGTQDILPQDSWKWQDMEARMRTILARYGYQEVRLPTFESTELFARGVGDSTDIVSKEMYTFEDKGGRSMTLRPEGTAGVVRATLENGLLASSPLPLKLYYIQSCFRYEKAQKGRLREFHQMGIECFGTHEPAADAEVIELCHAVLTEFGLARRVRLEINAIGCPKCRPNYLQSLVAYFTRYKRQLCPTCLERLESNPMRILDCKEEKCQMIASRAPVMLDYLCEDCTTHFGAVKKLLTGAGIGYKVNPRIVRGLDYYSNTVFEFVADGVGTQGTVCGGGRYNGLVEQLGGPHTPAVGFGMGQERLLLAIEENKISLNKPQAPILYAVAVDEPGRVAAHKLVGQLRAAGYIAESDLAGRSVKAQMKAANRLNVRYTLVLGEAEVKSGKAILKFMQDDIELEIEVRNIAAAIRAAEVYRTMGKPIEKAVDAIPDEAPSGRWAPEYEPCEIAVKALESIRGESVAIVPEITPAPLLVDELAEAAEEELEAVKSLLTPPEKAMELPQEPDVDTEGAELFAEVPEVDAETEEAELFADEPQQAEEEALAEEAPEEQEVAE